MQEISINDKAYPEQLLQISEPPKQIYVNGNIHLLSKNSIAIVGSRDCTEYGWKQASKFANELAKKGICVASGMAIGIDTAAHKASMKEKGKTIAVLGSGFDHIYPEENQQLYQQILENDGCIVTEYAPETKEHTSHFPRRNRIVSGLSMGVLVVEAKYRSGTTITARFAKEQKKEVFCIPSNLGEKTGVRN